LKFSGDREKQKGGEKKVGGGLKNRSRAGREGDRKKLAGVNFKTIKDGCLNEDGKRKKKQQ